MATASRFPTCRAFVAMGKTIDEAMVHAEESLRDYAIEARKDDAELAMPKPHRGCGGSRWQHPGLDSDDSLVRP